MSRLFPSRLTTEKGIFGNTSLHLLSVPADDGFIRPVRGSGNDHLSPSLPSAVEDDLLIQDPPLTLQINNCRPSQPCPSVLIPSQPTACDQRGEGTFPHQMCFGYGGVNVVHDPHNAREHQDNDVWSPQPCQPGRSFLVVFAMRSGTSPGNALRSTGAYPDRSHIQPTGSTISPVMACVATIGQDIF